LKEISIDTKSIIIKEMPISMQSSDLIYIFLLVLFFKLSYQSMVVQKYL